MNDAASPAGRDCWIGFDLGGTKMMAAVLDADMKPLGKERKKTKGHEGVEIVLERIIKTIRDALADGNRLAEVAGGQRQRQGGDPQRAEPVDVAGQADDQHPPADAALQHHGQAEHHDQRGVGLHVEPGPEVAHLTPRAGDVPVNPVQDEADDGDHDDRGDPYAVDPGTGHGRGQRGDPAQPGQPREGHGIGPAETGAAPQPLREPTAEGTLQRTPLVHLLVYMLDQRLSGSCVFQTPDGVTHGVYLEEGVPAKVRTGVPVWPLDRILLELGMVLVKRGLLALRLFVACALPLLFWMVVSFAATSVDDDGIVWGVAGAATAAFALARLMRPVGERETL